MGRFIWFIAGLNTSLSILLFAMEGPTTPFDWADKTIWTAYFLLMSAGWLVLSIRAAMGRFE